MPFLIAMVNYAPIKHAPASNVMWWLGSICYALGGLVFLLYGLWTIGDDLSGDRERRHLRQHRKNLQRLEMDTQDQQDFVSQIYRNGL